MKQLLPTFIRARFVLLVLISSLSLALFLIKPVQGVDISALHGRVVTKSNQPVPGCSVYLASQHFRTEPATTVTDGTFTLPIGNQLTVEIGNGSVYLEVYWGKDPLYRQPFDPRTAIIRNSVLEFPPIVLGKPQTKPASDGAVYYGLLVDPASDKWTDFNFDIPPGASKRPTRGERLTANSKMNVRADYMTITGAGIEWPIVTGVLEPHMQVVVTDVKTFPTREGTHFWIKMRTEN
jgi:hypothetical protein